MSTQVLMPGIHYGIPANIYHADPCQELSLSSGIARKILSESVAHAYFSHPKLGGGDKKTTNSMGLGQLVHSLMDDNLEKDWELGAFDSYRSGEARAWRDRVALSGKMPVLDSDLFEAKPVADALKSKVELPECRSEVTVVWCEGRVWCRARYDKLAITEQSAEFWDWKTSSNDLSDRGIIRTIAKYGYHIQVAFYLRGLAACTGLKPSSLSATLVFVATSAPYTVRRVRLSDMFLIKGNRQVDEAIKKWDMAINTGDWSDPREADVMEAEMPLYMDDQDIEISTNL